MHELAITRSMIVLVRDHMEKGHASKVGRINRVIGALSGVIGDFAQTYFDVETKGTLMENTQISFKGIPAKG